MEMSAQTVLDSVNKYRHGVLIGNFVQDKFGQDLVQMGANPDSDKQTMNMVQHTLRNSLYKDANKIPAHPPSHFYKKQVSSQYLRPQGQTTYNIFYRQQVDRKIPLLANEPKKESKREGSGENYTRTMQQLNDRFCLKGNLGDSLTGEVLRRDRKDEAATQIKGTVDPTIINPYATQSIVKPQIQKFEEVEYSKFVYPNAKGEHRDILFGHGIALEEFQRRQLATTYDLSYNQQIKPQTQLNSFFQPNHYQTAKEFHKETFYEKNHQNKIPSYGETAILSQTKAGRPYDPYTKTFDANHLKHQYLRN